jgi:hypothetical protein
MLSPRVLVEILNGVYTIVPEDDTMREGSVVVNVSYDVLCHAICVIIYHPSYDEVPDGEEVPRGDMTMRVDYDKAAPSFMDRPKML